MGVKMCNIFRRLRDIPRRLARLFSWISVIWSTDDYDYNFSLVIFAHSLQRLADHLRKHDFVMGAEADSRAILEVVRLLGRQSDSVHLGECLAPVEEMWGEMRMVFFKHPGIDLWTSEDYFDKALTLDDHIQADEEWDEAADRSDKVAGEEWNLTWERIAKEMQGWWD